MPTTTPTEKKDIPNVSRITFEFIRDNPGLTHRQVTARLVAQGYKEKTVSSLAYQMLRVRLIVADANGGLTAVVPEYVPIQTSLQRKKKAKVAQPKSKQVTIVNTRTGEVINPKATGIAALPTQHVTTALYTTPAEWSVDSVIGSLNVRQAMAVYSELRNIFGA